MPHRETRSPSPPPFFFSRLVWLLISRSSASLVNLLPHLVQESIVREVNSNPNAGWRADMNAAFSNYTVGTPVDRP